LRYAKAHGILEKYLKFKEKMFKAFQEGSRIAKHLSGTEKPDAYDPTYIRKVWYERKKQGKVRAVRSAFDTDSIYEYATPDPKE
jgi:hypothetical protein